MKKLLLPLFLIPLLVSCGKSKSEKAAYEEGAVAARHLVDSIAAMSEFEIEGYLLDVRATEYRYVIDGDSLASVAYIEGFENYIKENSPEVSSIIF